jgi:hypothetical protein
VSQYDGWDDAADDRETVKRHREGEGVMAKKKKSKGVLAWWFCAPDADGVVRLPHGDGREVRVGKTLRVEGKIIPCVRGLHASVRALGALRYAPGAMVCRVRMGGTIVREEDKLAASERTVLWMADASSTLRHFACDCAEEALRVAGGTPDPRSVEAIRVARRYADGKATRAELDAARAAAGAAAGAAAWDAANAAWAAAGAAAWDAACAAWDAAGTAARDEAWDAACAAWDAAGTAARDAARDAQNKALTKRLVALKPKGRE